MATGEEIQNFEHQTQAALSKVKMDAKVEPMESNDPSLLWKGIKTRTTSCVIMSSFEGGASGPGTPCQAVNPQPEDGPILEVPG